MLDKVVVVLVVSEQCQKNPREYDVEFVKFIINVGRGAYWEVNLASLEVNLSRVCVHSDPSVRTLT